MKTITKKQAKLEQTAKAITVMAARIYVLVAQIKTREEEIRDLKKAIDPFLPEGRTRAGDYRIDKTALQKKWLEYWRKAYTSITVRKMRARRKPKKELVIASCLLAFACIASAQTRNAYINERLPYALGLYPQIPSRYIQPPPQPPPYVWDGRWRTAATNVAKIEASMRVNSLEQSLLLRVNRTAQQEIKLANLSRALPFQQARIREERAIMDSVQAEYKLRELKTPALK